MKRIEFYLPEWQCVCVYDALKNINDRSAYIYHKPTKSTVLSFKFRSTEMTIKQEQEFFKSACRMFFTHIDKDTATLFKKITQQS